MANQEQAANNNSIQGEQSAEASQQQRDVREVEEKFERAKKELDAAINKLEDEAKQIEAGEAYSRLQTWVHENPTLAIFLAAGAGMLVGRLAAALFRSSPPPLSARARTQALLLASQVRKYLDEAGHAVSESTAQARRELGRSAHDLEKVLSRQAYELGEWTSKQSALVGEEVARRATDLSRRASEVGQKASLQAHELGDVMSKQVERASESVSKQAARLGDQASVLSKDVARRASETGTALSKQAQNTAKSAQKSVKRASKKVRRKTNPTFSDRVVGLLKTITAAALLKKFTGRKQKKGFFG